MCASRNGHIEVVGQLVRHGARHHFNDEYGMTALLLASCSGHIEVVAVLLDHGAEVDVVDEDGQTALQCAVRNNFVATVNMLLCHGAEVEGTSGFGSTPLIWASFAACSERCTRELQLVVKLNITTVSTLRVALQPPKRRYFVAVSRHYSRWHIWGPP